MYPRLLLSVLFALFNVIWADHVPYYQDDDYNRGKYGKYVDQKFKSTQEFVAPVFNFLKPFSACDDGSYLFITPRGHIVRPRAMIFDADGSVVWSTTRDYGKIYDFRVQQYKGRPHLTFWAGTDVVKGHGVGYHYVLDQKYEEVLRFAGVHDAGSDLHVFTITPQNSAVYMYYNATLGDTSSVSRWRSRGWIWDPVFQEVDLESGQVLFRWSALEHLKVSDSTVSLNAASAEDPWDPFHMNSVVKDSRGNYLVSFRYTNSIIYVDGKSGAILWYLGGKSNSFSDLSSGRATTFAGQHDAQWISEGIVISFFDNNADWYHETGDYSRGVYVRINTQTMSAEVERVFETPTKPPSASQGSCQTLPNGNVLLGYGFNAIVTEFSPSGEVLCNAYFEPSKFFGSGNVQSYHNLKFNWTAYPDTSPDLELDRRTQSLFVSWNGATEVRTWLFEGSDSEANGVLASGQEGVTFHNIGSAPKNGFETEFSLQDKSEVSNYIRAVGLDAHGKRLGVSKTVSVAKLAESLDSHRHELAVHRESLEDLSTQVEDHNGHSLLGLSVGKRSNGANYFWASLGVLTLLAACMRFCGVRLSSVLRRFRRTRTSWHLD